MASSSWSTISEKKVLNMQTVPEGCIASIISFTTPTDACRLALVSRDFLSASESDVVWERFLPFDYGLIVARSDGGAALLADFRNKKQLFMRLADRPLLVDDASKSFWVEKSSGKKCWMIAARSLSITWGDTPMYWKWTSIPESRFPEVAELLRVCWLEIHAKIPISSLSPNTRYVAYLVYNMTEYASGLDTNSEASVRIAGGEIKTRPVYLGVEYEQLQARRSWLWTYQSYPKPFWGLNRRRSQPGIIADRFPKRRGDGWKELKIGEFFNHLGEGDGEVELSIREVRDSNWKKGLIVEGIEVRPVEAQR